jgi:hypothetical protein
LSAVLLLVLAAVWGVIGFTWYRSRSSEGIGDSVGSFSRTLGVLDRRTGPKVVPPANRLRGGYPAAARGTTVESYFGNGFGRTAPASRMSAYQRRQSQKRRRDVLGVLAALVALTFFIAVLSGSGAAIMLQLLSDALLAGYVALLVRIRNAAAERDLRFTYRQPGASPRSAGSISGRPRPAAPRRRPAPSYEVSYGYEVAPGYGDLALRRAVN